MAKTTNSNDSIVTGSLVIYNQEEYIVAECYEDACIIHKAGERDIKVFKDDCEAI